VITGEPSRWVREGGRLLLSTRVLDLWSLRYRHPVRGTQKDFIVARAPDWVNVVAVTPEDKIILVRQFRFGSNDLSLEIPGGVMEQGEDPIAAAVRELSEETGYGGGRVSLMGSVHPNGAVPTGPMKWDHDEEIQVSAEGVPEVLALARKGGITHSLTIAALMFYEGVRAV